ncbi:MAG: hypothetical protein RJA29_2768, partial [Pseudomonadota bacterium]
MATVSIHAAGGSITPSKASGWTVRLATLAVWAALAGSVTYWVLQWPQDGAAREGLVTTLAGADEQIAPPAAASLNRALGAAAVGADRVSAP